MESREDQHESSRVAAVVEAVHNGSPLHDALGVTAAAVDALERQAYRMYQAGRIDETEVLAEGIVALDVRRAYPHLLLGEVHARRQRWDDALNEFEAAHQLDDASGLAAYRCGHALIQLGREDLAARRLQEAVSAVADGSAQPWRARAEGLLDRLEADNE